MRCIGGNIAKEWSIILVRFDILDGLCKENVGTIPFEWSWSAVNKVGIVKVIISPVVRNIPHPTSPMIYGQIKASLVR